MSHGLGPRQKHKRGQDKGCEELAERMPRETLDIQAWSYHHNAKPGRYASLGFQKSQAAQRIIYVAVRAPAPACRQLVSSHVSRVRWQGDVPSQLRRHARG